MSLREALIKVKHITKDNGRSAEIFWLDYEEKWQTTFYEDDGYTKRDYMITEHYDLAMSNALDWIEGEEER